MGMQIQEQPKYSQVQNAHYHSVIKNVKGKKNKYEA